MSSDPAAQPSEDEMRAAYEAELSRITSADMILQTAVSLLNLGGRRLGPIGDRPAPGSEGERDLAQVRDAVDGVRALLEILERSASAGELRPLRDALSQLQMAYAREAQAGAGAGPSARQGQVDSRQDVPAAGTPPAAPPTGAGSGAGAATKPADRPGAPPAKEKPGAGPAESSGRLWVPGR